MHTHRIRRLTTMLGAAAIAGGVALVGLGATAGAAPASAPFPAGTTMWRTNASITLGSMHLTLTGQMTGTSDGKGNITFPIGNIHFDPTTITASGLTIKVTTTANGPATSTINTTTGVVTLKGSVTQSLNITTGATDCRLGPIAQNLSSANAGGSKYTPTATTATATVTGSIALPALATSPTCPDAGTVNGALPKSGTVVNQLTIAPPGVKLAATTTTATTTTTVPAKVSSSTVAAGGQITISGNGWKAGSTVTLTLNSTPVALGTATVDASGAFTKTVTIPSSTPAGTHTITVSGTDPAARHARHRRRSRSRPPRSRPRQLRRHCPARQ